MPPERIFAIVANIVDRYRYRPCDLGKLTDRFVYGILFHKRDKDGSIPIPGDKLGFRAPEGPMTLEQHLNMLSGLAIFGRWSAEYTEGLRRELTERYAERAAETSDGKV